MFPSQNQQYVVEISRGDEEEDLGTNLENRSLPDSRTNTIRHNKKGNRGSH